MKVWRKEMLTKKWKSHKRIMANFILAKSNHNPRSFDVYKQIWLDCIKCSGALDSANVCNLCDGDLSLA